MGADLLTINHTLFFLAILFHLRWPFVWHLRCFFFFFSSLVCLQHFIHRSIFLGVWPNIYIDAGEYSQSEVKTFKIWGFLHIYVFTKKSMYACKYVFISLKGSGNTTSKIVFYSLIFRKIFHKFQDCYE